MWQPFIYLLHGMPILGQLSYLLPLFLLLSRVRLHFHPGRHHQIIHLRRPSPISRTRCSNTPIIIFFTVRRIVVYLNLPLAQGNDAALVLGLLGAVFLSELVDEGLQALLLLDPRLHVARRGVLRVGLVSPASEVIEGARNSLDLQRVHQAKGMRTDHVVQDVE